MISKEMYELLKRIPRHPKAIAYDELNKICEKDIFEIACEAEYKNCEYINISGLLARDKGCTLSLTEKGQAAIEDYKRTTHNQKMVEKSLAVSRIAMWAALGSAVAAIISLIKMLI